MTRLAQGVLLASILAVPAAISGVAGEPPPAGGDLAATPSWRIQAGPIRVTNDERLSVSGRFRLSPLSDRAAEEQALSGGACLVADLVPFGIGRAQCNTNADCNGPDVFNAQRDPRITDYVGYCAGRDGSGEPPRCWTRPGPATTHCLRSVDGLVLGPGEFILGPVDADPLGVGAGSPEWAVLACLAHPGHARACGEPLSIHRQVSLTPVGSVE